MMMLSKIRMTKKKVTANEDEYKMTSNMNNNRHNDRMIKNIILHAQQMTSNNIDNTFWFISRSCFGIYTCKYR